MSKYSTIFLQTVIIIVSCITLAFLLWEPQIEGRNIHTTLFQIYFNDFFLICVYLASIPIFIGLYQAFLVLGYIRQNRTFTPATRKALRTIRTCALWVIGCVLITTFFILSNDPDDRPAGLFIRLLVTMASLIVVATSGIFANIIEQGIDKQRDT